MAEKLEATAAQLRFRILFSRRNVAFSNISKMTLICKISLLVYVPKVLFLIIYLWFLGSWARQHARLCEQQDFAPTLQLIGDIITKKGWCRTVRKVGKFLQVFMLQVESISKQQLPALWGQNLNTSKNWSDIQFKQLNRTTTEVPCRRQPSV